jgi:hypothetical protein
VYVWGSWLSWYLLSLAKMPQKDSIVNDSLNLGIYCVIIYQLVDFSLADSINFVKEIIESCIVFSIKSNGRV